MSYQYITSEQGDDGIVFRHYQRPRCEECGQLGNEPGDDPRVRPHREGRPRARHDPDRSGRIFCSGGNIKRMTSQGRSLEPPDPTLREELYPQEADIRRVVTGLRRMSKPAIAAVNGPAIGSGLGIAAGCDMRIASSASRFGWVFVRRGIVPDDASLALMPQIIGYARAFEWGVTGRTIDAEGALEDRLCQRSRRAGSAVAALPRVGAGNHRQLPATDRAGIQVGAHRVAISGP